MYTVKIRDHIMIAHALKNPVFGPAQNLHGATYIIDVTFYSGDIGRYNIVIDMGLAHELLKEVLEPLQYKNLDEISEFSGKLTTTEFMAKYIHDKLKEKANSRFNGKIRVTLGESHISWGSYED